MQIIKQILVDLYIKNNEEEYNYSKIISKYLNNKYIFNIKEDKYEISLLDNIVIHKENSDSIINFIFDTTKYTTGTYYIKEMNFYMDAKIKTINLEKNSKYIKIEYKLWLQDEEIGNFIFKLEVKE